MNKSVLTLILLVYISASSIAQSDSIYAYGLDILKKAENSFCKGDSEQTIKLLEYYTNKFPDKATTILLSKRLSDFYIQLNKKEQAISTLTRALALKPKGDVLFYKDTCGLYNKLDYSSIKADICVELSKMYINSGNYPTALSYLILADTKYLPSYGGCANGMIMYKTKLSLSFADFYLMVRDTSKAVDRLIEYFLSDEAFSDKVTDKLKTILLTTYTQKQITDEVNNGIMTMKIVEVQNGNA
ncbi:MAG TPA: hypothetical protein VK590_07290, partial [Saprospiraceae bacterium]|nr:hypothetical protein [Saprospiraceae bacterium]